VIVGHGDIASAIIDRSDRLFFCSGVSNSLETANSAYQRESNLLLAQNRHAHLVYFSSLCVFYASSRYAQHKRLMECIVADEFKHHTIIRLGNMDWGTNPHTLINHLRARHAAGLPLDIQPVTRYVVGLAEFQHWLGMIPPWPCEMNIPGRSMTVAEIVREYATCEAVAALR
jgi:hypothetical protein